MNLENYLNRNLQNCSYCRTEDTAFPLQTTFRSFSTETITTAGRGPETTPPQLPL